MARAGFWKLVTVPPTAPFFFLGPWELGILESGNCDHFTGTACMHVSRNAKGPATLQGPRRAQRLGQSARRCSARRDMGHFDARLDTWAHVRSPGCGSRVVLYVSILQLAHELLAQNCLVSTWLT